MENSNVAHLNDVNNDDYADDSATDSRQENLKTFLAQPDPDFMKKLSTASEEFSQIKIDRQELNDAANMIMARFEKYGLNKHAVKAAMRYQGMDKKLRDNYDLSYAVMRKAQGSPLQDDLFVAQAAKTINDHVSSAAH